VQESEIEAHAVRGQAIYAASQKGTRRLTGAEVEADYNAERVHSEPADIEILSPDGTKVKAMFDLASLR